MNYFYWSALAILIVALLAYQLGGDTLEGYHSYRRFYYPQYSATRYYRPHLYSRRYNSYIGRYPNTYSGSSNIYTRGYSNRYPWYWMPRRWFSSYNYW